MNPDHCEACGTWCSGRFCPIHAHLEDSMPVIPDNPKQALAAAALAGRCGDYDNAIGWCVVAALDYYAAASEEQRLHFRRTLLDSLANEMARREVEKRVPLGVEEE